MVGPDGNATLTGGLQAKQAAVAEEGACGSILSLMSRVRDVEPVTPALLRTERLLAARLRQHGPPEWPDPRPDGTSPLSGTPYATTGKSGLFLQAMNACRQYATNGSRRHEAGRCPRLGHRGGGRRGRRRRLDLRVRPLARHGHPAAAPPAPMSTTVVRRGTLTVSEQDPGPSATPTRSRSTARRPGR